MALTLDPEKKQKDFKYFKQLFASESVKGLLKDLKVSMRTAKEKSLPKNPTLGSLDFKVAMIRK